MRKFCEPDIEQFSNQARHLNDRWLWQVYSDIQQAIALHSLNVEIPLAEIYRRIDF
ncbi:hypothetical protein [Anabaena azotica]|uniref:hypothetical protein n=1 Tax=Anabaena azotica TaxID=197653 RepID=UPI001F555D83|nr:hypothetical protein [Anabaena azotica]